MVIIATMIQNEHEEKIVRIRQAVKRFHTEGKPFRIFHGSTNSTRILSFKQSEMIDTSDLNEIIAIDTDRQTALV
jgi:urocanate hydratase